MFPPLLEQHVQELRNEGYSIEMVESTNDVFIIFKDYPLPLQKWNRDKTDLLIRATIVYPNSQLDMFWVTPGLTLRDGRAPKSGDAIENYAGKQWQRFSWHVNGWNPATDSLLTYLGVVNSRFCINE